MSRRKDKPPPVAPQLDSVEAGPAFFEILREPTCLVGIGHPLRRDDGVGPWIAGAVRDDLAGSHLGVVDAQDVPENFVPGIARGGWRNVVFIDAVAVEGEAGTVVFGPLAEFAEAEGFSTHKLALALSRKFLEAAGKNVYLLGIVPADLEFGEGLTVEVERAARRLREVIIRAARGRD